MNRSKTRTGKKVKKIERNPKAFVSPKLEGATLEPVTQIYATNELLQGKYANVAFIKHTPREFVFDFIWAVENHRILASRIITNPAHAKEVYEALGKNIERYEKAHGKIEITEQRK